MLEFFFHNKKVKTVTKKAVNAKGLKSLITPLSSKIVDSNKNIENIGAILLSPGFVNQKEIIKEREKLNNKILNILFLTKKEINKLIKKEIKI